MLYALSYGPALKAVQKGILGNQIMMVYRPLESLIHQPALGKPSECISLSGAPGLDPQWRMGRLSRVALI